MPDALEENKTQLPKSAKSYNEAEDLYANLIEQTYFKSPYVQDSYLAPYNPDDLYQKHFDYSIYEKMAQDDQVSVCLRLKKDLVLGDGFQIQPGGEGQDEIVDFLKHSLNNHYEGDFSGDLEEILSAYDFGFSLSEKVFQVKDGSMLSLKQMITRHPNSWLIHQDEKGKVSKYIQRTVKGDLEINPKSLIHFINDKRFQNPYGSSDLRYAYNAWITKLHVVRYLSIFLEKAASPIPVGRYDKNAPPGFSDTLLNILKKFQTKTAITIPKDVEIEFLEAKNTGEAYRNAIHLFNMFIGRALFVPDLVGFTGSETGGGSFSLGKEQINLFFLHVQRRRNSLEATIQKEIIQPIIKYNFGDIQNPPTFKFKPLDDQKALEFAKVWLEAVKGSAYKANDEEINHFRKLVKFPEGEVLRIVQQTEPDQEKIQDDNEEKNNQPSVEAGSKLPVAGQKISDTALNGAQVTALVEVVQAVAVGRLPRGSAIALIESAFLVDSAEAERILGEAGRGFVPKDLLEQKGIDSGSGNKKFKIQELIERKKFAKAFDETPGDYHKKVSFKALKTKLDDYDTSLLNEVGPVVRKMMLDLNDQIEKKKIIQGQNIDRIDSLSLKYKKELKQILKNSFFGLYKDSYKQAESEIQKSDFAKKPLAEDKYLEVLDAEVFNFIGDYEYTILKRVRVELIAAVKDGKSLSSVLGILDDQLKPLSDVALERYARTKHTEVMNNGRKEFFDSTGVVSGYQYSAIMDERTSDICSGLHGKFFKAGTEPVPPMHFNCRSTLIPITKYEEFKPTETIRGMTPDQFIEENKGVGFSKYTLEDKKEVKEYAREPKITDEGVEFDTEVINETQESIKYYLKGRCFKETIITYGTKDRIKGDYVSIKHKKVLTNEK